MTFLELIKSPITDLPIQYNGSFRETLKDRINNFGEIIDSSEDLSGPVNGIDFKPEPFKRRNRIIREGIMNAVDAYYKGAPSEAYTILSAALKEANITGYLNKNYELPVGTNLYRIRTATQNYPLNKEELFHIPFHLRSKVSTQRYSIPGLPSLYLANSVYVAWEELKRPGISEIQAVRLVNNESLVLLDLTNDIFSRNNEWVDNTAYGWQFLYKVMVWPLIAACSFKVQNPKDPFIPEYIIPQLLLQWVNKSVVDGIKYSSTHVDLASLKNEGSFYNIVIPVKTTNIESGHCPILLRRFNSTQVLPLQLRQFVTISDRLAHQGSINSDVNSDIFGIELIRGYSQPYSSTIFGVLEHNLLGIQDEPLI